uniref:Ubiquitin-like protease family profile domain-containing protein n=1 Tax=Oryza glumipatula TaxID=40148 RepID=A0A0D9Z5H9_9ORYZ
MSHLKYELQEKTLQVERLQRDIEKCSLELEEKDSKLTLSEQNRLELHQLLSRCQNSLKFWKCAVLFFIFLSTGKPTPASIFSSSPRSDLRHHQSYSSYVFFHPPSRSVFFHPRNPVIQDEDFLDSKFVRDCFVGDDLSYDVENCRMIIVPVYNNNTWACYCWDFLKKMISVLDPNLMSGKSENVYLNHSHALDTLHNGMVQCIQKFFNGWEVDYSWRHRYTALLTKHCKKYVH